MTSDSDEIRVVLRVDHRLDDPERHCLAVLGSSHELGCWKPDKAIRAEYMGRSTWQAVVKLPPNESVVWKWVVIDVNSSEIVEWESGVDKVLDVKDKPLMGVCDWGNPVDITDISSESSVRLFQGVHDIGELSPSRRRDRAREQSAERLDQSTEKRNQSIERQNPSTDRRKRSTERRRRSIERRKRSQDRRKQSLEVSSQGKDGKGKKVKRVKSKTKVPEDSTDKLRNVRSQNHSEAKIKMSSAKDVKAMAGACQLSPTDSTGENRFIIPEAPVKVKHSNGLKDFFLRKLRSQASKPRTNGKVLGKAIHAGKETAETRSDKDPLSGSSKVVEYMDESDINTRKSGASNPENVHSTHKTAKHTELGKHLLNSILSDENLAEETLELESAEQIDKRNIDRTDVYSYVSLGFATDCITALDRQGDPSENTALIGMNMKDYDLVNSVSDSIIASDKVTHTPVKTKSEDSLYGCTVGARQTDVNAIERRKETDTMLRLETDAHEGPQNIVNGDCNVKSVKDAKNIFETEHSAESLPSKKNGRKPTKLNDAKDHALAEKANKGLKHNESSREDFASDKAVQKEHLCKNDTSENGSEDDSLIIKNPEQTHCRESLQKKLLPHCEIPNETKELEMKVSEVKNETKDAVTGNEVSAATRKNVANYLNGEASDETFCKEKQPPECITAPFAKNNDMLIIEGGTCTKSEYGKDNSFDKCNVASHQPNCRKAPKVPEKTYRKFRSFANEQKQYNTLEDIDSTSVASNRKGNVFKNVQFCGNSIKVEQESLSKLNGNTISPEKQKELAGNVHNKDVDHLNGASAEIKDNVSEDKDTHLKSITEGKCKSGGVLTEIDNQNDELNTCIVTNNIDEQESVLENQRDFSTGSVATCRGPEGTSDKDKANEETSYANVQENLLQHNSQNQISHITNDLVGQPDLKSMKIKCTFGTFTENLKPQTTCDREQSSHGKDVAEKEHGCVSKSSVKTKASLYSTHSIANKYLSVVNSQDSASHLTTTTQSSGPETPKGSENTKTIDTNTEAAAALPPKEALVNDQSLVNMPENDNVGNHNQVNHSRQSEYLESDAQEKVKTDKDYKQDNRSDTITYIDETGQASAHRPNKSGSIDSRNNPRRFHSPKLSPKTKVNQWLKQTHTETNSDEGQQNMYANQTTPKDVSEYLNDLHKETPSYTKSVVALLEQNINCVGKASSDQQALEDGYEVTKKYSECNKTIDYANDSNNSPRCDSEAKEQNIETVEQDSNGSSLWDLVDKYKFPIGVSIAAACATVLICKKKL